MLQVIEPEWRLLGRWHIEWEPNRWSSAPTVQRDRPSLCRSRAVPSPSHVPTNKTIVPDTQSNMKRLSCGIVVVVVVVFILVCWERRMSNVARCQPSPRRPHARQTLAPHTPVAVQSCRLWAARERTLTHSSMLVYHWQTPFCSRTQTNELQQLSEQFY